MKPHVWNEEKNKWLKQERDICFEDVVRAIHGNCVLDILVHPLKDKYPTQKIYVLEINQYIYLVPFVEDDEKVFLKTIHADRRATKKYLRS